MSHPQLQRLDDQGFTLVELLVVITLGGILSAFGVTGMRAYLRSSQLDGSSSDVVSVVRNTAERALSEGRTYCVSFDTATSTYRAYRIACDGTTGVATSQATKLRGKVTLAAPAFTRPSSTKPCLTDAGTTGTSSCVYFFPRGTATDGTIDITLGSKTRRVTLKGLTARVDVA